MRGRPRIVSPARTPKPLAEPRLEPAAPEREGDVSLDCLVREWLLELKVMGRSPRTIDWYAQKMRFYLVASNARLLPPVEIPASARPSSASASDGGGRRDFRPDRYGRARAEMVGRATWRSMAGSLWCSMSRGTGFPLLSSNPAARKPRVIRSRRSLPRPHGLYIPRAFGAACGSESVCSPAPFRIGLRQMTRQRGYAGDTWTTTHQLHVSELVLPARLPREVTGHRSCQILVLEEVVERPLGGRVAD